MEGVGGCGTLPCDANKPLQKGRSGNCSSKHPRVGKAIQLSTHGQKPCRDDNDQLPVRCAARYDRAAHSARAPRKSSRLAEVGDIQG